MQRKPIANKYRKGTMKSTLHSTYATYQCLGTFTLRVQAPKGVKERVKSPYRITSKFLANMTIPHNIFIFYGRKNEFYSAKYNRTERLCIFLMVAGCYVILIALYVLL